MTEEEKRLLRKYWEGGCTQEKELQEVNRLLHTKEGNQLFYELFMQQGAKEIENPEPLNTVMQEWVREKQSELSQYTSNSNTRPSRPFLSRTILRWGSLAAVFVGVIILSGVFLWNNQNDLGLLGSKEQAVAYAELSNPDGIPELHQLPDGTQIWLAAGSTLKYPEQFSGKHRDVELTGEAFFDVARDEARPFTIRTGEMQTRVLGTSFKITAFAGQEQEVSVATGKVSVSSNKQELAKLTRGLKVRYNSETGETTQAEIDPTTLEEWKSGVLFFDKLPMSLVAQQLENRYGIEIQFADSGIASRRVRSKVRPQDSIETILHALGYIGNFNYKSTDNKHYTIY